MDGRNLTPGVTSTVSYADGDISILDQTLLPHEERTVVLRSVDEIAEAIVRLRVRGAPALGIIGGFGVAQALRYARSESPTHLLAVGREAADRLAATRPTAVNLRWGVERVLTAARTNRTSAVRMIHAAEEEARAILREDEQACAAMADHAQTFFRHEQVILTHCNTGALGTGGIGTALGAIITAHQIGHDIAVVATETRPLLQGARLTAWELKRAGVPHAVVVDGAAPGLIARGEIDLVIVGADRIAVNGDVANKVGTYPLALAAAAADVPFVVVAPWSTVDPSTRSGADIEIEERDKEEVTTIGGVLRASPMGTLAINPAFDVTPYELITAIVTERGISHPPFGPLHLDEQVGMRKTAAAKRAAAKKKPGARPAPKKQPVVKKAASNKGRKVASKKATPRKAVASTGKRAPAVKAKRASRAKKATSSKPTRRAKR